MKKITVWKYPCEKTFEIGKHRDVYIKAWSGLYTNKRALLSCNASCWCGKNCKPVKIVIEEMEA